MKVEQFIREKIGTLSAGQRKVAEYVLKNQDLFSYSTLTKLSKEIAVSETTIIRLAYSLGFESFSSLQQKVREEILTEPQRRAEGSIAKGSCYQSVIAKEMLMLENWKNHLDEETLDHFITLLLEADKILVIGARSSYSASLWFGAILERLLGNVYVVKEFYDSRMELISGVTEKTVAVSISFARYTKWTYQYTKVLKKRGAKVLSITDSIISPIVEIADQSMIVDSNMDEMGFNSVVCLYVLFDTIIAKIQKKHKNKISDRLRTLETVYSDMDLFFE